MDFYDLFADLIGSDFSNAIRDVSAIAGYEITVEEQKPFLEFSEWINSRPKFISDWRSNHNTEHNEYLRFMTITDGLRNGYAATKYHLDRLVEIKRGIEEVLNSYNLSSKIMPNSTVAIGNTIKLDFEYHAFLFSYRRCLEYIAVGFSTYFGKRDSNFIEFGKNVQRW